MEDFMSSKVKLFFFRVSFFPSFFIPLFLYPSSLPIKKRCLLKRKLENPVSSLRSVQSLDFLPPLPLAPISLENDSVLRLPSPRSSQLGFVFEKRRRKKDRQNKISNREKRIYERGEGLD